MITSQADKPLKLLSLLYTHKVLDENSNTLLFLGWHMVLFSDTDPPHSSTILGVCGTKILTADPLDLSQD